MRISGRAILWLMSTMLIIAGCSPAKPKEKGEDSPPPDVVLITFDTTRADHLGPYGCKYAFTPTLDKLAKQSIQFNSAYAPAPITLPSHTTIMTGLYPFYHGVRDNAHFVVKPEISTLAEAMSDAGYQTGATLAAFVLDAQFGLDQGFDHYDDRVETRAVFSPFAVPERIAEHVTDAAIKWLETIDRDKPYFLWVHYYDPHAGYRPPATFTKYQGQPYDMEIAYADSELGRLLAFIEESAPGKRRPVIVFTGDHGDALGQYGEQTHAYFAYDSTMHVPLLVRLPGEEHAGDQIDTAVGIVDIMPTILDVAGQKVPPPDTMHGRSLRPLWDSAQPPAELVDRALAFECYEPYYGYGWAPVRGVRVGDVKFFDVPKPELYILSENPREIPEANVYAQQPELAAKMRERFRFLWDAPLSVPSFAATPQAPDEETLSKLRALGYAAAPLPVEETDEARADVKDMLGFYNRSLEAMLMIGNGEIENAMQMLMELARQDPKSARVLSAFLYLGNNVPEVADRVLPLMQRQLAAGNVPSDLMASVLLCCAQMSVFQGDISEALRYCREALAVDPESATGNWAYGRILLCEGQAEASLEPFKRATEMFGPKAYNRQAVYGVALMAAGKYQQGLELWREIVRGQGEGTRLWAPATLCSFKEDLARVALPAIRKAESEGAPDASMLAALKLAESDCLRLHGRFEEALQALESASAQLSADDAAYMTAKAHLLVSLGKIDEAEGLLAKVCERNPADTNAVRAYAAILESLGKFDRGVEVLEQLHEAYPSDPMIMNDLAWMLGRQGTHISRALVLANQAADALPGSPTLIDTLGWLYHLDGRDRFAAGVLGKARSLLPNSAGTAYRYAVALKAVGRTDEAKTHFVAAVALAGESRPDWYEEAKAEAAAQP